jgi:hypothetical protein
MRQSGARPKKPKNPTPVILDPALVSAVGDALGVAFSKCQARARASHVTFDQLSQMLVRRILGDVQNGERDPRRLSEGAMEWAADNLLPLTLPTVATQPIHLSDADVAATELEHPERPRLMMQDELHANAA